jgi:hypothetical protein
MLRRVETQRTMSPTGLGRPGAVRRRDQCDLSTAALELFAPGPISHVWKRIVELSVRANADCDSAGLFVVENARVVTAACTDNGIIDLDRLQFDADEGPCLDAVSERRAYYACDLVGDARWPRFRVGAARAGVRSVFAIPLAISGASALAFYGLRPSMFCPGAQARASHFTTLAAIALDVAAQRASEEDGRSIAPDRATHTRRRHLRLVAP